MSTQRFVLTGLLILALLAPGAAASTGQPAREAKSAANAPADDNFPPPDWTYGPATGMLAAAGDVNGDGFDDALIVDPQNAPWTPVTARLFYGSPDGLPTEPDWSLADHWQTCPAGDVNGDGFDDLFTAGLDGLQVFYGSPYGPVPGAPWHGASVSLSGAGDVNGDGYGPITDGGGNLSYPDTTCPGINADPVLGLLQDNGGPTWTMALGEEDAAIDAGDDAICAAEPVNNLDQRGVTRPQGQHCDIGALEQITEPSPVRRYLPLILRG